MKSLASLAPLLLLVAAAPLPAQRDLAGTPEIEQSLRKLDELGTVLMIGAHPDDERTPVLAYFARGRHMRTAYLSATRGEGGQNLIGSEQGAQLGLVRTQELLAARRVDGAEQFFTRAIDFGFTTSAKETLEKWGHDRILSDMVWVIRRYRPDVVILCFTGTPRDGHGQHQASGILGREAYAAAGDSSRFPEQLRYVKPWHAYRLVQSTFRRNPSEKPTTLVAETGAFNPILGYSYDEIASMSRSMHRSQGMGNMRRLGGGRGEFPGRAEFTVVSGPPATHDIFEGIDTTWNRLSGGAAIGQILSNAIRNFEPQHPEKTIAELVKARPAIAAIDDPLARIKLTQLDEAIAQCAGLWIEAQARAPEAAPGSKVHITTTVLNRSAVPVTLESAELEGIWNQPLPHTAAALGDNQSAALEFDGEVPASQPYSQPYWLVKPPDGNTYTVDDQKLIGLADTPPVEQVKLRLSVEGATIELTRPVHYRYADRAIGERVRPFVIAPAVAVNLPNPVSMFPSAAPRRVEVALQANVPNAAGELHIDIPSGWKVEPPSRTFDVATAGGQTQLMFDVTPPAGASTAELRAVATVGGRRIDSGMQVIAYSHIPTQTLFPPSQAKLVRADIRVTAHKIGYIMGAGDEMPDALRQLGLEVTLLSPSDLELGDLSRFDAIVAGVRAYNVRADVRANQPRLLDYVRNGGTYIVQYNTGDNSLDMGPYPFNVPPGDRYRVTVEEAPVAFPHPDSPLLQAPNHITQKDFEGWVQERGLYFALKWDPRYQTVLESHDPGAAPLEGGELWTRYGKGVYIFTAYDWFRQLPAGVPGAYRLFANLLSARQTVAERAGR